MALPSTNVNDLLDLSFADATGAGVVAQKVMGVVGATPIPMLPAAGISLTASATGAASAITATLAAAVGKTTFITGFQITGAGATGASVIVVTITGVITGTMSYDIVVPAGVSGRIITLLVNLSVAVSALAPDAPEVLYDRPLEA